MFPQQFSLLYFDIGNSQREKLFRWLLAGGSADWRRWLIGRTVRINNEVGHGMFRNQRMQSDLGAEQRDDLHFELHAVHSQIGRLIGGFPSVDHQIANVHAKAERDSVQLADLNAAAGSLFERGDDPAPNHLLKGIGSGVPAQQAQGDGTEEAEQPKQFPPTPTLDGSRLTQGV